ncbi:hypothetical protein [Virgibacillus sp. SK37]|uniref:hypothetical protein n=1 Tax=Virgibacillus sp. SK37 TaxID=403957 RepID=UPI0004D1C0EB|nr:hypothetical protein [Virgibacillus sp. SK37]AIF45741.1 hypothetical protein X953_19895 [Virgibacillus sp. SK37]
MIAIIIMTMLFLAAALFIIDMQDRGGEVMTIGKIRTILYKLAKILGDINAVKRGRVKQRIKNRVIGKFTGRLFK